MPATDLDQSGRQQQVVRTWAGPSLGWIYTDKPTLITYVIDGGGQVLTTGVKGPLIVPEWCFVYRWILIADRVSSAVVDIWKTAYPTYPPTVANSITGSAPPTLSAQLNADSQTLTGWTTMLNQNDAIMYNINSVASAQRLTLALVCARIIGDPAL